MDSGAGSVSTGGSASAVLDVVDDSVVLDAVDNSVALDVVDESVVWVVEVDEIWLVLPGKADVDSTVVDSVVGTGSKVNTEV